MITWEDVMEVEIPGERRLYGTMCSGITVHRQGRALIVKLPNDFFRALSSGFTNGGFVESPQAVMNISGIGGKVEYTCMVGGLSTFDEMNRRYASKLGLDPMRTVFQGTAANMDNASVVNMQTGSGIDVSLAITGGISHNGGRAGDPTTYDESRDTGNTKSGTIISIMAIDAELSDSAMLEAMLLATEAKSCVIQELQARSHYSYGIATGSGTDQVTIIMNRSSPHKVDRILKSSDLAITIAECLAAGLRDTFDRQAGMNPVTQWDPLVLMERYQIDMIREEIRFPARMEELLSSLEVLRKDPHSTAMVSVMLNIADDVRNGLIPEEDGMELARTICEDHVIRRRTDPVERLRIDNQESVIDLLSYVCALKLMEKVESRRCGDEQRGDRDPQ